MSSIMDLQEALEKGVVVVTFKKVDGSIRTMRAGLREDVSGYDVKTDNFTVMDEDKGDYRTFRASSIIDWSEG